MLFPLIVQGTHKEITPALAKSGLEFAKSKGKGLGGDHAGVFQALKGCFSIIPASELASWIDAFNAVPGGKVWSDVSSCQNVLPTRFAQQGVENARHPCPHRRRLQRSSCRRQLSTRTAVRMLCSTSSGAFVCKRCSARRANYGICLHFF